MTDMEKIKEVEDKIIDKIYNAIVVNDSVKSPENIMYVAKAMKYLKESHIEHKDTAHHDSKEVM